MFLFLVLLETSGNQNYIFSTNKLKENIGASELTYRAGTQWILDAINSDLGITRYHQALQQCSLPEVLLDPTINQLIDTPDNPIEIIMASSGKVLILTKEERVAQTLIRSVTAKALEAGPGLELFGVYHPFNWTETSIGKANRNVHALYEFERAHKPSRDFRYLRLPVVAACATSGLSAQKLSRDPETNHNQIPLSAVSLAKEACRDDGIARVNHLLAQKYPGYSFAKNTNELEQKSKTEWQAVVHADGNGLGEIFLNFQNHIVPPHSDQDAEITANNRAYVNQLRQFSLALDRCTENAFLAALPVFFDSNPNSTLIPLTPLILGGDDLTVVCDGTVAIDFAREFLLNFEYQTSQPQVTFGSIVADIAQQALDVRRLSACAGIAIIKNHFPFATAYDLAEQLLKSAKTVKTHVIHGETQKPYPCSALDFHILYDSSNVSLDRIRSNLQLTHDIYLYCRPYVVTAQDYLPSDPAWSQFHHWDELSKRIQILQDQQIPNSQLHDLRAGIHLGPELSQAQYQLIRNRYGYGISQSHKVQLHGLIPGNNKVRCTSEDQEMLYAIRVLEGQNGSLFETDPDQKQVCRLLDCMDACAFVRRVADV